jgi:hypothetical protein
MHLKDDEYQVFKTHFHCAAGSDEQYCIPVRVDTPSGDASWSTYLSGAQFRGARDWLTQWRVDGSPQAEAPPAAAPQPNRHHSHLHWMSRLADSLRAVFGKWAPRERH